MALRWGICSSGKISHDFMCGLSTLDPSLHVVASVASRSLERSQKFAELHQIPKAYGTYKELADDEEIDIVYIGSINSEHFPLCKLYLNQGKNVVCEKPMVLNVKEATEILSLAKEKNVFFMEAVWSRFFPVYHKIREIIAQDEIGEVKVVQVTFGLPLIIKERVAKKELGGGAMYDIGMYTAQLALMVFGDDFPQSISASGHLTSEGVDESATIALLYPSNKMASLTYSAVCTLDNAAEICGTEGKIRICAPFWCPTQMEVTKKATGKTEQFQFPVPSSKVKPFFDNSTGLRYQAEAARQAINDGKKEHEFMSHKASLVLATVVEKVRNSLGYVREGDGASV